MKMVLDIYNNSKSDVLKVYLGPKLYVALANPHDIEASIFTQIWLTTL